MPGRQARQDVRTLLLPALRRPEGDVHGVVSSRALRGMRHQGHTRRSAGVRGCGREIVSQLAVRHGSAEARRPFARCLKSKNRLQPAVSDSATSSAGLALSPANKIIFAVVAVLSVGGMIVSGI